MRTIILENENYRIVKDTTGNEAGVLTNDFYSRNMRCRLRLGAVTAALEKKMSTFIFWSYWHRIEFTNIANVVQEWMTKYFNGAKLNNNPNKND